MLDRLRLFLKHFIGQSLKEPVALPLTNDAIVLDGPICKVLVSPSYVDRFNGIPGSGQPAEVTAQIDEYRDMTRVSSQLLGRLGIRSLPGYDGLYFVNLAVGNDKVISVFDDIPVREFASGAVNEPQVIIGADILSRCHVDRERGRVLVTPTMRA